jgi:uncharacterized protein (DUF305 family)
MRSPNLVLAAALLALPGLALAQAHHGGHSETAPAQPSDTPATKAYRDVNARMHRDMAIQFSNNSDIDFVRSMIPHHQGAIEMAKIALENTKDEQVRQWATDVVREQEREIAEMRAWLKAKGAL